MQANGAERRIPLSILDSASAPAVPETELADGDLKRRERNLKTLADELAQGLQHLERALIASKGAGFSGRVQDLFDELQMLQREVAREYGRKVGDRLGRESLWRVRKGIDAD